MEEKTITIAIVGGTGKEGKGLAHRWLNAGYTVLIGSRSIEKAAQAANELEQKVGGVRNVKGFVNRDAARQADVVVITVPYAAHTETLKTIAPFVQGKLVVDVTVPLVPPKVTKVQIPADGCAALEARRILGDQVEIGSAFQNISYEHLLNDEPIECDVLVCGTGKETREKVLKLVADAGLKGWDAGPLENSIVAEGLTSILIGINKQFSIDSAGIKITGVSRIS
jgi:hypothetical protein